MSLQDILSNGRQAVSVLTDPHKAGTAAGALTGAFAAEANTLKKDLLGKVESYTRKAEGTLGGIGGSISYLLGGDKTAPGAATMKQGLSLTTWAVIAGIAFFVLYLFRGRK